MEREKKLTVLMDGQAYGVTEACKKHHISRTLYYRWLKRYNALGLIGLDQITKDFTPKNKTAPPVIALLMTLVKKNPHYGPRALKYLLEDFNYDISESAVYNTLKTLKLSTKQQRNKFAHKREKNPAHVSPSFTELKGGEGWLFWTTYVGHFNGLGNLYTYTFLDYRSKIACSRLYSTLSTAHFENLLTAVAMPIAQMLQFEPKHLFIPEHDPLCGKHPHIFLSEIEKATHHSGFEVAVHKLGEYPLKLVDPPHNSKNEEGIQVQHLKNSYNQHCLSALLPWIQQGLSHQEIIIKFQQHIRDYNLHHKTLYDHQEIASPFEYYAKSKNTELILPLWAYIDRDY